MGLNQILETQPFATTGEIRIKDLTFYPRDSDDLVDEKSHAFALQLDSVFRHIRGATFEADVDQQKAVEAMQTILKDGTRTVADLADIADDSYLFFGEEVPA